MSALFDAQMVAQADQALAAVGRDVDAMVADATAMLACEPDPSQAVALLIAGYLSGLADDLPLQAQTLLEFAVVMAVRLAQAGGVR